MVANSSAYATMSDNRNLPDIPSYTNSTSAGPPIEGELLITTGDIGSMLLENKVAIITGAGTGIGEAIAHKFAREGARLALGGMSTDPVRDVAETIVAAGGDAEFHLGDLAEEVEARALVNLALQRFGRNRRAGEQCRYFHCQRQYRGLPH